MLPIFPTMITKRNCSTKLGAGLNEQEKKTGRIFKYTMFQTYSMAKQETKSRETVSSVVTYINTVTKNYTIFLEAGM